MPVRVRPCLSVSVRASPCASFYSDLFRISDFPLRRAALFASLPSFSSLSCQSVSVRVRPPQKTQPRLAISTRPSSADLTPPSWSTTPPFPRVHPANLPAASPELTLPAKYITACSPAYCSKGSGILLNPTSPHCRPTLHFHIRPHLNPPLGPVKKNL